ncbi:MAG: hypothetical protein ACFFAU_19770 [Candidatus Hodarchaeota archaeon]
MENPNQEEIISPKLDTKTRAFLIRYLIIDSTRLIAFSISGMFIILYLLDTLTPTEVGLLFAVNYLILTLVDYPTGVLGDVIGHKKVMLIAYFLHFVSILFLISSKELTPLLLYSTISALATSQESGALEAWFDNNYRIMTELTDPDRKIYKSFQAKKSILEYTLSGLSFVIGGIIAEHFSRQFLFSGSLLLVGVVFFLLIFFMGENLLNQSENTFKGYLRQFTKGIHFLVSKKGVLFFFIGSTVIWAANNSLWVNFLLFRIYGGYSGNQDDTTAFLRTILFGTGVFWQLVILRYLPKIRNLKFWIPFTNALSNTIFFFAIYIYYLVFPPMGVDIFLILGLIVIFQLPSIWEPLEFVLRNRLNLDLVPDDIRNSVYSLLPSIMNFLGIFMALIGGTYIKSFGFASTILLTSIISGIGLILSIFGINWIENLAVSDNSSE